jgi:hypothetical protein
LTPLIIRPVRLGFIYVGNVTSSHKDNSSLVVQLRLLRQCEGRGWSIGEDDWTERPRKFCKCGIVRLLLSRDGVEETNTVKTQRKMSEHDRVQWSFGFQTQDSVFRESTRAVQHKNNGQNGWNTSRERKLSEWPETRRDDFWERESGK